MLQTAASDLGAVANYHFHDQGFLGLPGTKPERATCGTIRVQLLKIGALVTITLRRVKFAFASACPSRDTFVAGATAIMRLTRDRRA